MKEEVVLMLSELRSQIDDTISRLKKESALDGKEIMSTLEDCGLIKVCDYLIYPQAFLEWCFSRRFLETEGEVFTVGGNPWIGNKYVSKNDLINLDENGRVTVHPSLLYVYFKTR